MPADHDPVRLDRLEHNRAVIAALDIRKSFQRDRNRVKRARTTWFDALDGQVVVAKLRKQRGTLRRA